MGRGSTLTQAGLVSFRAFSAAEFLLQMLPVVMVALFIERVLEVFLESWRANRRSVY